MKRFRLIQKSMIILTATRLVNSFFRLMRNNWKILTKFEVHELIRAKLLT